MFIFYGIHCCTRVGAGIYINAYRYTLHWRHNDHDVVSNYQPHGCLLNRLFRRRSKKTSKLRVTGLCVGNSPGPVNSPHKGPVARKMFPFDDVIMGDSPDISLFAACLPLSRKRPIRLSANKIVIFTTRESRHVNCLIITGDVFFSYK